MNASTVYVFATKISREHFAILEFAKSRQISAKMVEYAQRMEPVFVKAVTLESE